jgi:hypothetical protein
MAAGRIPTTANSPITAKGDLFTYSTAPARLAVGNDGESLVADSSTSTGLRYQAIQTRNLVYNSGTDIWQRGTSFTASGYCADRWYAAFNGGTGRTVSRQTGTDQFQYVQRIQRNSGNTSTTAMDFGQSFEIADATPFAGKTVTVSFYARKGADFSGASSALPVFVYSGTSSTEANRVTTAYASGGATAGSTTATLTTSLQRFQFTFTFGSTVTQFAILATINWAGTAGTNDYIDITGFQLEVGSIATNYARQSGTIQGELAACQRYYWRRTGTQYLGTGSVNSSTQGDFMIQFATEMRTAPTMATNSGTAYFKVFAGNVDTTASTIGNFYTAGTLTVLGRITGSGLTTGQGCIGYINNASGYVEASAEL